MSENTPEAAPAKGPRVITLRLRLPVLVTAVLLLLIGLAWMFFMGVLAGRDYRTQEQIGALAAFMPAPPVTEATGSLSPGEEGIPPGAAGLNALFESGSLLESEDLDFKGNLKTPAESHLPSNLQNAGNESGGAVVTPESLQAGGRDALTAQQLQAGQTGPGNPELLVASPNESLYEYVYQVSALNQQHQAQALKQRLLDAGIAAQVEVHRAQNTTWFRVLVSFRGKNSELPAFMERLDQFKLGQPILRKKQAISGQ